MSGDVLPVTPAVLTLVAADMTDIALATVAAVDAIGRWNFTHIVRLEKIRWFNAVNVELGCRALSILSPREVTTDEGH